MFNKIHKYTHVKKWVNLYSRKKFEKNRKFLIRKTVRDVRLKNREGDREIYLHFREMGDKCTTSDYASTYICFILFIDKDKKYSIFTLFFSWKGWIDSCILLFIFKLKESVVIFSSFFSDNFFSNNTFLPQNFSLFSLFALFVEVLFIEHVLVWIEKEKKSNNTNDLKMLQNVFQA